MQWFRVYNEILDDPKVAKMDGETFRCFIYLLAISSEQETNGIINMSVFDISWRIRVPINTLEAAIAYFLENNILVKKDDSFVITNWKKRQFASDNVGQRVKRYREKQCNVTSNVSGNVIEAEADTEADTEAEAEQKQSEDEKKTAFMNNLKNALDKTKDRYPLPKDQQAILVFVQASIHNKNPDAILHCINSIMKAPEKIKSLPAYLNAALKIEDGKYNAMESERKCNEFKKMDVGMFDKITNNIGQRI